MAVAFTGFIFALKFNYCNGTQKLLCGNVKKFPIAKNGCAHRVPHTQISLGLKFRVIVKSRVIVHVLFLEHLRYFEF